MPRSGRSTLCNLGFPWNRIFPLTLARTGRLRFERAVLFHSIKVLPMVRIFGIDNFSKALPMKPAEELMWTKEGTSNTSQLETERLYASWRLGSDTSSVGPFDLNDIYSEALIGRVMLVRDGLSWIVTVSAVSILSQPSAVKPVWLILTVDTLVSAEVQPVSVRLGRLYKSNLSIFRREEKETDVKTSLLRIDNSCPIVTRSSALRSVSWSPDRQERSPVMVDRPLIDMLVAESGSSTTSPSNVAHSPSAVA